MTRKQKKTLIRIIITLVLFAGLMPCHIIGLFENLPEFIKAAMFFVPYMIIGYDVLWAAWRNIIRGNAFDEHFLMGIATLAAFGMGLFGEGEYPEALGVMLFYQIGELFQSYAVGKSRNSIAEMMAIAPDWAYVEKDGEIEEVDPEDVHIDDILVVRPGEKIPLDGIVIEGDSFIDTAALTGESVPRRASVGDEVISGCVNGNATLKVRATKEFEDSTVSRILELVENASSRKARIENFITRFAKYYTPIVTIAAVALAIAIPLLIDVNWLEGVRRACNFLIVSCPCALVISVPLGFFGGIGAASRIGVLVKGSNYLELAANMKTLVMDKTGTLTKGEFKVSHVIPAGDITEDAIIEMAAHGEGHSTHPIAASILNAYGKSIDLTRVSDSSEAAGHGVNVKFDGKGLLLGNAKLMNANNIEYVPCEETGTIVYVAYDGKFAGCIVISDTIKEGAIEAIKGLKAAGVSKTVMLTGDNAKTANAVGGSLGIDLVKSELLPADKVSQVEALITELEGTKDKLGFVGDGINDAPVLMRSDVGFAMGSLGSDAAIEAADIVIMDDDIRKIPAAIRIAKKTMGIVKSNIAFALLVKAAILVLSAFGMVSMWVAVFGDVGVAIICILNSMRALKVR
ncbi:MAG: heavy metal translocating P-type ATPase [Firmicutes bacterium]|nr:heavy metal translocating P-type ATPase [Bacillota bacterium]